MSHKDICINFKIVLDNIEYYFEAVGCLEDDEESATIEEACHCTGERVVTNYDYWRWLIRDER
jgi:hypothetical protein